MSTSGPVTSFRDCTSFRVMRSSSGSVRSLGSQQTPPLAPPNGTSTTAVFQVFRLDRLQPTDLRQHPCRQGCSGLGGASGSNTMADPWTLRSSVLSEQALPKQSERPYDTSYLSTYHA